MLIIKGFETTPCQLKKLLKMFQNNKKSILYFICFQLFCFLAHSQDCGKVCKESRSFLSKSEILVFFESGFNQNVTIAIEGDTLFSEHLISDTINEVAGNPIPIPNYLIKKELKLISNNCELNLFVNPRFRYIYVNWVDEFEVILSNDKLIYE